MECNILGPDGKPSKLFKFLLTKTDGNFNDALKIYADTQTKAFQEISGINTKEREPTYTEIKKFFGDRVAKFRSSRGSIDPYMKVTKNNLDKHKDIKLDPSTHIYSKESSEIEAVTKFIENQGLATPFSKKDLKEGMFKRYKDSLQDKGQNIKTAGATEDEIKQNINDFVENVSQLNEPGTVLHNALETAFLSYSQTLKRSKDIDSQKINAAIEEALTEGYNTLVTTKVNGISWFDSTSEVETNFKDTARSIMKSVINSSGESSEILPEQRLGYNNEEGITILAGTSDLVVIKPNGRADIYDFKFSYKHLNDWNRHKNEAIYAQQRTYTKMLNQMGVIVDSVKIIAVEMNMNFDTKNVSGLSSPMFRDIRNILGAERSLQIDEKLDAELPVSIAQEAESKLEDNDNLKGFMQSYFDYSLEGESSRVVEAEIKDDDPSFESFITGHMNTFVKRGGKTVFRNPYAKNEEERVINVKKKIDEYAKSKNYPDGATFISDHPTDKGIRDIFKKALKKPYIDRLNSRSEYYNKITSWIEEQRLNLNNNDYSYNDAVLYFPNEVKKNLKLILEKYVFDKNWEIIKDPRLEELGIIALYNTGNKVWEFINVTDKLLKESIIHDNDKTRIISGRQRSTILGKHIDSNNIKHLEVMDSTVESYESVKLAAFIASNKELFKDAKIGKRSFTITTNGGARDKDSVKINDLEHTLSQINQVINHQSTSGINEALDNTILEFQSKILPQAYNSWIDEAVLHAYSIMGELVNVDNESFQRRKETSKLKHKVKTEGGRLVEYGTFFGKLHELDTEIDFDHEEKKNEAIALINKLITELYQGRDKLSSKKDQTSELIGYLSAALLELKDLEIGLNNISKQFGTLIDNNYMFSMPSDLVEKSEKISKQLINQAARETENSMYEFARDTHAKALAPLYTEKDLEYKKNLMHALRGSYLKAFDNLLEKNDEGLFTMRLRDPEEKGSYDYNKFGQSELTNAEKEYIRFFMKIVNDVRMSKMTDIQKDVFNEDKDRQREIPLMKATITTNIERKQMRQVISEYIDEMINPARAFDEDIEFRRAQEERKVLPNMFDFYENENNRSNKEKFIEESLNSGKDLFETNLELLLTTYVLADKKQKSFNKILPTVSAIRSHLIMQSMGYGSNTEESVKQLDLMLDSAVFTKKDKLSQNKELDDTLQKSTKILQNTVYVSNLSLNFFSGITQLTQGTFQIFMQMADNSADPENKPGLKDFMFASKIMFGETSAVIGNVTTANELNRLYAINDDLLSNPKPLTEQTHGFMNFSEFLSWMNTAPDYFVRMTMLIAKMKKQGVWDAHSLDKDNVLRYNPRKDNRFSKAFTANGKLKSKSELKTDEERKQLVALQGLIANLGEDMLDKDGLPKIAYDWREQESIKKEGDNIMGAYDSRDRILAKQIAGYSLLFQFRTWLIAMKRMHWFDSKGKRSDVEGRWQVVPKKDASGEIIKDEDGNIEYQRVWQGSYHEGMFNSILYFMGQFDISNPGSMVKNLKENWNTLEEDVKIKRIGNLRRMLAEMLIFLAGMIMSEAIGKKSPEGKIIMKSVQDLWVLNTIGMFVGSKNPIPAFSYASQVASTTLDIFADAAKGEFEGSATRIGKMFGPTRNIVTISEMLN